MGHDVSENTRTRLSPRCASGSGWEKRRVKSFFSAVFLTRDCFGVFRKSVRCVARFSSTCSFVPCVARGPKLSRGSDARKHTKKSRLFEARNRDRKRRKRHAGRMRFVKRTILFLQTNKLERADMMRPWSSPRARLFTRRGSSLVTGWSR
jgi:hypothetical protein